jgi:hypothetical protein
MDNWASIESTFIADGRFLRDHGPHPRWQPLWYCGTRFDYIYPPALRYGTASISKVFGVTPARAYHLYTAFFYCIGIVGVYLLVRIGARSRVAAWLAASAAALLSPSFLLLPQFLRDSSFLEPQRLHVLLRYGEGPHMTAFALLPPALALSFAALRARRPAALAGAALLSALVVSNNFYGATALAIWFPILVWSVWITHQHRRAWLGAIGIAALAYGLCALWLVPSYVRVTVDNLKIVAKPGNNWSMAAALAVAAAAGWLSWRFARGKPALAWPVFVWCSFAAYMLNVVGQGWFGFRVAGEPLRLVPELDLAIILAGVEVVRQIWRRYRIAAVAVVLIAFYPAVRYLKHAWELYPADPDHTRRVEFRMADWMARNLPGARAFVTGSVRFWYNTWHDLPQVGGGSEQGLLNPNLMPAFWEINLGPDPKPTVLWLQALGADAIIIHDRSSEEIYHDSVYPKKLAGVLPVLLDDGRGNVIYRVPRRFPGLARVVDRGRAAALGPVRSNTDVERLEPYVDVVENGPNAPVSMQWEGTDAAVVRVSVGPDESVLVQMTYDPYWRAYSSGTRLPVRRDALGQMLIDAPSGDHTIRLVFELPLENLVGRVLTGVSLLVCGALVIGAARGGRHGPTGRRWPSAAPSG